MSKEMIVKLRGPIYLVTDPSASSQVSKLASWKVSDDTVVDLHFIDGAVQAEVKRRSERYIIPNYYIEGISKEMLEKPEYLRLILADSYARIVPLENDEFKLYINLPVKGGIEWYWLAIGAGVLILAGAVVVVASVGAAGAAGAASVAAASGAAGTTTIVANGITIVTTTTAATATAAATATSTALAGLVGATATAGTVGAATTASASILGIGINTTLTGIIGAAVVGGGCYCADEAKNEYDKTLTQPVLVAAPEIVIQPIPVAAPAAAESVNIEEIRQAREQIQANVQRERELLAEIDRLREEKSTAQKKNEKMTVLVRLQDQKIKDKEKELNVSKEELGAAKRIEQKLTALVVKQREKLRVPNQESSQSHAASAPGFSNS